MKYQNELNLIAHTDMPKQSQNMIQFLNIRCLPLDSPIRARDEPKFSNSTRLSHFHSYLSTWRPFSKKNINNSARIQEMIIHSHSMNMFPGTKHLPTTYIIVHEITPQLLNTSCFCTTKVA
uniref:AlNc14C248G9588 protein n=1 Tax=Albugo laibachii Nc14 TaxID=890382 RepID=F0WTA3_9STRA|nr:AlNc14C248G9588 [Albugo laibachii Nc14]|eukprot:CCA24592.1 AlNc14C248G9588 [Albugo laibachii Nc14]